MTTVTIKSSLRQPQNGPASGKTANMPPPKITAASPLPDGPVHCLYFDGALVNCRRLPPRPRKQVGGVAGQMGVGWWIGCRREWSAPGYPEPAAQSNDPGCWSLVASRSTILPEGTSNEAEYHALLHGLRHAHRLLICRLRIHTDSELVCRQINRRYEARQKHLRSLRDEAFDLLHLFREWDIQWIDREENTLADRLSRCEWGTKTDPYPCEGADEAGEKSGIQASRAIYTDQQVARMRFWYLKGYCRNPCFLARTFGGDRNNARSAMRGQTYKHVTEEHLTDATYTP